MSTLADVTIYDLIANRPSPSIPGRLFFASDTGNAYYDTGSAWQAIATGGGGGSGSLTLLDSQTASNSAALLFVSDIVSTYDDYLIELVSLIPATTAADILLQVSTNNGSSYDTTSGHYGWASFRWVFNATGEGGGTSEASICLSAGTGELVTTAANGGYSGSFRMFNPLGATAATAVSGQGWYKPVGGDDVGVVQAGEYNLTTAVNAFQLIASNGNIASGTARLYGFSK